MGDAYRYNQETKKWEEYEYPTGICDICKHKYSVTYWQERNPNRCYIHQDAFVGKEQVECKNGMDMENDEKGYLHIEQRAGWTCNVPFGLPIRMIEKRPDEPTSIVAYNGHIHEEYNSHVRGLVVCESPSEVYNANWVLVKKYRNKDSVFEVKDAKDGPGV